MLAQAEHDVLSDVLVVALENFDVAELEKAGSRSTRIPAPAKYCLKSDRSSPYRAC